MGLPRVGCHSGGQPRGAASRLPSCPGASLSRLGHPADQDHPIPPAPPPGAHGTSPALAAGRHAGRLAARRPGGRLQRGRRTRPTLVDTHPAWLIALNARNRNLILVSNYLDPWTFYGIGIVRLLISDPLFFLLGYWYGDAAR